VDAAITEIVASSKMPCFIRISWTGAP